MKYIVINPKNFNLSLATKLPTEGFIVPLTLAHTFRELSPLENVLYYEVLYHARHARDRRERISGVRYKLFEPDPWMIALAYIMWKGIVQGLTWDTVKILVVKALGKLRSFGVAPAGDSTKRKTESKTEIGFSWTEYSRDGRKLYHVFVGLKRVFNKTSKKERHAITKSTIHERNSIKGKK